MEDNQEVQENQEITKRKNSLIEFMEQKWVITLSTWVMILVMGFLIYYAINHVNEIMSDACNVCVKAGYQCLKYKEIFGG